MTYCGKRPGNSHLRAATARVNMNLLKGALLLSKRHWINKTAFVKKVSVTQKHTLRAQGAIEANDNSNEWVFYVLLTARTYRDIDLGLKSNMKGLRSLGLNSWPRLTRQEALPLHHRGTILPIFHTVKYLIKGLQTFPHALPLHLHQASTMTLLIN